MTFRAINREGYRNAWRRLRIQRRILNTPPLRTAGSGQVEVRVLTHRRDWINAIWALKSFYHHAQVDYPLFIHDGGLNAAQGHYLLEHFPDATILPQDETTRVVTEALRRRGLEHCAEARTRFFMTQKLFDVTLMSRAENLLLIDSDIIFFRRPDALIVPPEELAVNKYNADSEEPCYYSASPEELERAIGVRPVRRVNAGLALIRRWTIDPDQIERWLEYPAFFEHPWLIEQTLHALCSTVHGIELLPPTYMLDMAPGLRDDVVCRHYPGVCRSLLYTEGMTRLLEQGFLNELCTSRTVAVPSGS